jgi:Trypsin-like peptidase domain
MNTPDSAGDDSAKSFTATKDPLCVLRRGGSLRLEWVRPSFGPYPHRFCRPQNWQMFEGAVLAISIATHQRHQILGSAVMVAPGVALSVNHVLEDHLDKLRAGRIEILCIGIASHGAPAWRVKYVTCVDRTDLCLMSLELLSELPPTRVLYHAALTMRVPALGEPLVLTGFRAGQGEFPRGKDGTDELAMSLLLGSGVVTDEYPSGRGRTLPWPAVGVDAPSISGMSGGPVFDARGFVVGLISSSMENAPGEEPVPTFVAVPRPALGQRFPHRSPLLPNTYRSGSLLDLAGTACVIERADAVRASEHGGRTTVEYALWH